MKTILNSCEQFLCLILTPILVIIGFGIGVKLLNCRMHLAELPSQVPILMDLATGETTELRIFSPHTLQKKGYFTFISLGSAQGYCDGGVRCQFSFPDQNHKINTHLFCRKCRTLLDSVGSTGFTVLYYDDQTIHIYPILPNTTYTLPTNIIQCFEEGTRMTLNIEPRP